VEIAIAFALEAGPQVRDEDLGALVEAHLAPLEGHLVPEAGEVLCEQVDERRSGVVRLVDAVGEARVESLVFQSVNKIARKMHWTKQMRYEMQMVI